MEIKLSNDHVYTVDGKVFPGVTTIISDVYGKYPYPEGAAERGHHVHLATQLYDEDDLDESSLDEVVKGYLEGYKLFREEMGFTPTDIERRVYNETYGYCGTVDRIGILNDKKVLLDIKSGNPEHWHEIQVFAYDLCFDKPHHRYCLYLRPNGTYKLVEYKDRKILQVWLSTLIVYKWRKDHGC